MRTVTHLLVLLLLVVGRDAASSAEVKSQPPTIIKVQGYDPNNPENPETQALAALMAADKSIQIQRWGGLALPGASGDRASLMMAIAGRTAPDIFSSYFHALNNDTKQGFFYPLNEWIGDDRNGNGQIDDDEAKWDGWKNEPRLWRQVATGNGRIYAIPQAELYYWALIFRSDLVRQSGLDPNDPPQTWDAFYTWCQKLTGPNRPMKGLPPPSQRAFGIAPQGFQWLPWMQSAGGHPVLQTRISPTTGKAYTFEMEATDFKTPDGEDLTKVTPTWRANFAAPEGVAAAAFYHKLRWGKWIYDPRTLEPVSLTESDLARGWTKIGRRKINLMPDDVIVGVTRTVDDAQNDPSTAGNPMANGQVVIKASTVTDLLNAANSAGLPPDQLSWIPIPASGPHGVRVIQVQHHYLVLGEAVGRRPKAERDKIWRALLAMTGEGVTLDADRYQVLAGMARFVPPDDLRKLGFADYLKEIPPVIAHNFDDIQSGKIRSFVEPYMGFWDPMNTALGNEVLGLILNRGGESFDYAAGLQKVQDEANGGIMFGRSEASLDVYRPVARVVGLAAIALLFGMVAVITRGFLRKVRVGQGVHQRFLPWLLLGPAILLIAIWSYYPLMRGMVMAFQNYTIVGTSPFVGFDNFITLCLDPTWWATLGRTLYFVALNLTLAFLAPIVLALMLSEVPRGKVLYRTLFFLPQVTSGLVIALLWKLMFDPTPDGFFNQLLLLLNYLPFVHIPPQAWLQDSRMAMICCVVPTVWAGMGMSSLLYLAALKGVPEEAYEAAEIDGAGIWHKLTKITFPSILPLILINFVGAFIGTFQSMGSILLLTFGGPGDSTMVAGLRIWIEAYTNLRFSMATSMAWMLGVFLMGFTYIQIKILQRVEFKKTD